MTQLARLENVDQDDIKEVLIAEMEVVLDFPGGNNQAGNGRSNGTLSDESDEKIENMLREVISLAMQLTGKKGKNVRIVLYITGPASIVPIAARFPEIRRVTPNSGRDQVPVDFFCECSTLQ